MLIPFDRKQNVEADKWQLRSKVFPSQFLSYKPTPQISGSFGNTASRSFPETSEEIASFCHNFNARGILNSERHLIKCLFESGIWKEQLHHLQSLPSFAFPRKSKMSKWQILLVIDSWSLTAPIRNSFRRGTEFRKTTMTSGKRNFHSPNPLLIRLFHVEAEKSTANLTASLFWNS